MAFIPARWETSDASLLISANIGAKVVQKYIGHSSFAITHDRYGHLYPNEAGQPVSRAVKAVFAIGERQSTMMPDVHHMLHRWQSPDK